MPHTPPAVPAFTKWPSFPFEGEFRAKQLDEPVAVEPPRKGEGSSECISCNTPDDAYIWVSERWRVRAMDRPSGLPMVLILETRSHYDLGDLPNLLAAELGVMTVRLERAVRSLDGVARVHVNRWGDGSAHLHIWFLARPYGQLQLRGTFLALWDDILPPIPEAQWRENLALVAAWLAEFGGRPLAEPSRIQWQAPSSLNQQQTQSLAAPVTGGGSDILPEQLPAPTDLDPAPGPGGVGTDPAAPGDAVPSGDAASSGESAPVGPETTPADIASAGPADADLTGPDPAGIPEASPTPAAAGVVPVSDGIADGGVSKPSGATARGEAALPGTATPGATAAAAIATTPATAAAAIAGATSVAAAPDSAGETGLADDQIARDRG